jgi:hypothetical protein
LLLTSDLAASPYAAPLAPGGALSDLAATRETYHALREQLEDALEGPRGLAVRLSAGASDEAVAAAGARWLRRRPRAPGAPSDVPGAGRVRRERAVHRRAGAGALPGRPGGRRPDVQHRGRRRARARLSAIQSFQCRCDAPAPDVRGPAP